MLSTTYYTIDTIKDEARNLVEQGLVNRHQPIYTLCQFIPVREWEHVELELQEHNYLLRDHIIDLLAQDVWAND